MNPKKLQYFWGIIFLILGLIITLQMKSVQKEANLNKRQKDLKTLQLFLKQEKDRSAALSEQLKIYEAKADDVEKKSFKGKEIESLKTELDKARFEAGLTDVSGRGLTIDMDDSKQVINQGEDPNDYVIHEWELLHLINLLRASGARAISINNERLISISELQCAGPTISVNRVRFAIPFKLKVIGDPDYLEAVLKGDKVVNKMLARGIKVSPKKEEKVVLPKYRDLMTKGSSNIDKGGQGQI